MHIKEKKERALGTRLFLKSNRCNSPKCALVRKPYPPGIFGKKRKRSKSEMGTELLEKQRIKFSYSLDEAQLQSIFKTALRNPKSTSTIMFQLLERRFDNIVYRLGFANSRANGRQLVGHGHLLINGKRTTIPSYVVKVGDLISWRPESKRFELYKSAETNAGKAQVVEWLKLNPKEMTGKMTSLPKSDDIPFNMSLLVEYYSR